MAARLATLPDWIQNVDGFYFIDGVERYAVREMRPFFPGYPVYIWCGKLLAILTGGAASGLRLVSVSASILSLWPIAWLARDWARLVGADEREADGSGRLAAWAWVLAPLPWLVGTEIFSDPLGLLLALLVLWLCFRALTRPNLADRLVPMASALAGLMLGARLAYVILLVPLLFTGIRLRRVPRLTRRATLAFALALGSWLGWQMVQDGMSLGHAARAQWVRHLHAPALTLIQDSGGASRLLAYLRTVLFDGLGGWWPGEIPVRLAPTAVWMTLVFWAAVKLQRAPRSAAAGAVWLFALPCILATYALFDVRFPRYSLPMVAIVAVLAGLGRPRGRASGTVAMVLLVSTLLSVSVPLALEHQKSAPLPSQLARFVREELDPARTAIVFAANDPIAYGLFFKREAPDYLSVWEGREHDIASLEALFREQGRTVHATAPPRQAPEDWVPVARFCRSVEVDARTAVELWLFRRDPGNRADRSVPGCRK